MNKLYAPTSDVVSGIEKNNVNRVRQLAGECVVLLENNGALPLDSKVKKIALFGSGAKNTIKGGTGSGDVNSREIVSIFDGLKAAGYHVVTERLLDKYQKLLAQSVKDYVQFVKDETERTGLADCAIQFSTPYVEPDFFELSEKNTPARADVCIYVLSRNSGEGKDRKFAKGDYLLTDREEWNINFLSRRYKKFILLLNIGGVIDSKFFKKNQSIGATLLIGQLGNMTGHVVADILKGKQMPTGRLVDTWAANYSDYPSSETFSGNNGNLDDEYYEEGVFVGYRYFDSFGVTVCYPFGYGLSYTSFEYSSTSVKIEDRDLVINTTVKNTGDKYSGREVVQVYVTSPDETRPAQELVGFCKTGVIAPGESEKVSIRVDVASLAYYDEEKTSRILKSGSYLVRMGSHSRKSNIVAVLNIPETVVCERYMKFFSDDSPVKEKFTVRKTTQIPGASNDLTWAEKVTFNTNKITYRDVRYTKERRELVNSHEDKTLTIDDVLKLNVTVPELVAQLSVSEMADIVVGTLRWEDNHGNMVGHVNNHVPGAAAETTEKYLETRGIGALVLADGPAGLRLTPHFKAKPDGTVLPGGEVFGQTKMPFPEDTPADAVDYYQYCTAIPIATSLASSWNMDLIEEMGQIVGSEMTKYHVDLWLAPGMNIHRNPLCGRNFEYYSEDPLITGKAAAADTRGVQSTGRHGTTIKHYACNNQEDNRLFTSAHLTDRTLREIYLKGFEIAVKESSPYAIMTSYNLLNGYHTAQRYDLIQNILRDEWEFDGLVMTDWYSSQDSSFLGGEHSDKYSYADDVACVQAGNDLQMPGCKENVDNIIAAVESGKLKKADLQFCAVNVLNTLIKCI